MNNELNSEGCCCGDSTDEHGAATWQSRYESGETGWDRGECSPALMNWLEAGALKPCRILVPGCGRGHEVVELASRGFDVTAIDFASAAVHALEEQLLSAGLKADVTSADFFQYRAPEKFDAIYEQTCLCAIDPKRRKEYAQQLANSIRPGGDVFALFMQSGKMDAGPPFPCALDDMRQLFAAPHWNWPEEQAVIVEHPAGLKEIAVVLSRSEAA